MKRIMLLHLLLCMLCHTPLLKGQSFSRTVHTDSLAPESVQKAAWRFAADKERFLVVNGRVKSREWVFGRARWGTSGRATYGFDARDPASKNMTGHCLLGYEIRGHMGCIQLLIVSGDVGIRFGEGETTISITNLTYAHYNTEAPPNLAAIIGNGVCKSTGTLESLRSCKVCDKSLEAFFRFADGALNDLMGQYEKEIRAGGGN